MSLHSSFVHSRLCALAVLSLAIVLPACCSPGSMLETPPTIDPVESKWLDVGIGEVITFKLQVTPGEYWDPMDVADPITSCNCLLAEWEEEPDEDGGVILATITSNEVEKITGSVMLENGERQKLCEHFAEIDIRPRPFVSPRAVEITPETGTEFKLTFGMAFKADSEEQLLVGTIEAPGFEITDVESGGKVYVEGFRHQRETVVYQLSGELAEKVNSSSGKGTEGSEQLTMKVSLINPEAEFEVKVTVRW